jgi:hypothetical protein
MTKKTKIIVSVSGLLLGVGLFAVGKTYASVLTGNDGQTKLVQMIADKFSLQNSDVQSVFDQFRTDRQTEMEAAYKTQLAQYVTDGKITEDQKI